MKPAEITRKSFFSLIAAALGMRSGYLRPVECITVSHDGTTAIPPEYYPGFGQGPFYPGYPVPDYTESSGHYV